MSQQQRTVDGPVPTGRTAPAHLDELAQALEQAEAVIVGAGAGLSAAAGLTYSGERFERLFPDFIARYGLTDMYSAGFHPFPSPEVRWAYWSRHIWLNRYEPGPLPTYARLVRLLAGREHTVITTNVDHQLQLAGADRTRLFYTQGDYGLWQCSAPCHVATYDNEETVREMVLRQRDLQVPGELVPHCPVCGEPMAMNLRVDASFVQDEGWHEAAERHRAFLTAHQGERVLLLELGVGANTPAIIKYPFWAMTADNPHATYACLNLGQVGAPSAIADRSVLIDADIDTALSALEPMLATGGRP